MQEALQIVQNWGPWGLLAALVILVLTNPEKAERVGGWFLGLFSWVSSGILHRSIKLKLQGQVSSFARSIDGEAKGAMPYNLRLRFVKGADRSEFDPTTRTVIVCLKDRGAEDRNLVHAMMVFCVGGVLPQARSYLGVAMNEGINITMTRKFLNSLKHHSALQYLYDKVLPACAEEVPELDSVCRVLDVLDESGLFTRVVLEEVRDFGARVETRYPDESHADEAAAFVAYIHRVATRSEGEELEEIGHLGRYITTAFVFVGTRLTMERGSVDYLRHLQRVKAAGFDKAYLAARGAPKGSSERSQSIQMAQKVGYLAERKKLAKRGRDMEYYAAASDGISRLHVLIELTMLHSTS